MKNISFVTSVVRKSCFFAGVLISLSGVVYAQSQNSETPDNRQTALTITEHIVDEADMVPPVADSEQERQAIIESRTHIPGVLTLRDGRVIEGDFRFDYRQTKEGWVSINTQQGVKDEDKDNVVWHFSENAKGRIKSIAYKAKDVTGFKVNDTEIYDVIKYKPSFLEAAAADGGAIGLKSIGSLMGATKTEKFVLRVYTTPKLGLYHSNGLYIIHKNGTEEAIAGRYFTAKDLVKFAEDYPEIVEKINQNVYEEQTPEKYILFVDDMTKVM